ncbi:tripartite tricarboxylate transporter TctB family protein [Thalassobaculum sp. OXR-137]|uniref:tripartite tricarboxylate transporter TctB family protein n=1 Tax=Thalassobaculum sp. OXR-137 TaxID=3100173 RepID=UPI002AC99A53|nr:tripartite tricarboxylate transporter TctB family protein [Thalassobaculum sp. OXR-137]WPZ32743.1 tripartite tricarboxylate transporter TctB family protein [Thalassobaculum sp. OXR-137]
MNGTRIAGIVGCLASAVFLAVMVPGVEENRFTGGGAQFYTVGPTFVPYFSGALMLLFSVMLTVAPGAGGSGPAEDRTGPGRALLFMALLVAFVLGLREIGFMIAAILFLAATFACFRAGRPVLSAAIAVAAPVGIDLLLRKVLMVPLPTAPFLN